MRTVDLMPYIWKVAHDFVVCLTTRICSAPSRSRRRIYGRSAVAVPSDPRCNSPFWRMRSKFAAPILSPPVSSPLRAVKNSTSHSWNRTSCITRTSRDGAITIILIRVLTCSSVPPTTSSCSSKLQGAQTQTKLTKKRKSCGRLSRRCKRP